jgi:hypothetical protein
VVEGEGETVAVGEEVAVAVVMPVLAVVGEFDELDEEGAMQLSSVA